MLIASADKLTNRYDSATTGYDVTCTYDDAGNTTTDQNGYQYTYDYENRISQIKDASDSLVASFNYDALGQRIRKVDHKTTANTRIYYYNDNWQVLTEYDGSDTFKRYRKAFAKLLLNLRPEFFFGWQGVQNWQ
ncbi:hypothetical protein STSP2_02515 [Anaerohalosphaera lusitana]|uniref:YD repeat (Two copies) n=1 Tax=Anaerohalosphaera lusitana TaxID=1936003 RepID=A0A1U9NP92_9BACT|nr:hypothetical protein [Anaerohalosphaera lusitana]AQT69326.1 hypothetical protein STSP2_02515 [Anaerohalosphaera lusitana]